VDEAERGAIRRKQRKPRVEHEVIRERCERKVRGQQLGAVEAQAARADANVWV